MLRLYVSAWRADHNTDLTASRFGCCTHIANNEAEAKALAAAEAAAKAPGSDYKTPDVVTMPLAYQQLVEAANLLLTQQGQRGIAWRDPSTM